MNKIKLNTIFMIYVQNNNTVQTIRHGTSPFKMVSSIAIFYY